MRAYLLAVFRVVGRTGVVLAVAAGLLLVALGAIPSGLGMFRFPDDCGWACILLAVGLVCVWRATRLLSDYFRHRMSPRTQSVVWEWPSEIVRRQEEQRHQARQGIELMAGTAPAGTGTEMESGRAPDGRGTELQSGPPRA